MRTITRPVTAVSVLAVVAGAIVIAGPLDPPEGPVSGTYKTLAEVEPRIPIGPDTTPGDHLAHFRIHEPGSYYLTGNITGEDRYGIMISADAVTIDLMGFEVEGGGSIFGGIFVYHDTETFDNITICNGAVRGWGMDGVNLGLADGVRVYNLHASFNDGDGITAGNRAVVTGCVATNNTDWGIDVGHGSVVSDCTASQNGDGMTGGSAVFERCVATGNGHWGFNVGSGAVITECTALGNTAAGIVMQGGGVARGNVSSQNEFGIQLTGESNRVEDNLCKWNQVGFHAIDPGNLIVSNTAFENTLNWDVIEQNACLVVRVKLSGAIRGDEGGVPPGSSEPTANFSFGR